MKTLEDNVKVEKPKSKLGIQDKAVEKTKVKHTRT